MRYLAVLAIVPAVVLAQPAHGGKPWVGRAAEIEAFIRTAPIVRMEDVSRGVTRPATGDLRAVLERRRAMQAQIDKMIRATSAERVFVR